MNKNLKSALRYLMPRSIRDHRILGGALRGFHIYTSWHDYPGAILGRTERPLLEWFSKNVGPGETWLDIGSHYGYTALALSRLVGTSGRVFAFEPMLSTAGYLAQTRLLNRFPQMIVIPMALGTPDTVRLGELPAVRGMLDSTLVDHPCAEAFLLTRLDWLWPQISGKQERIHGVKIDVQGMEIEVLRGMTNLLETFRPKLAVEFHHGVARKDLISLLDAAGYSPKGVPIEPLDEEDEPQYIDDRSYAFQASTTAAQASRIVGCEQAHV